MQADREAVEFFATQTERSMRLQRRRECSLDSDVHLLRAASKPDAAAISQRLRLLDLLESEKVTKEPPRLCFASFRGSELNVIDFDVLHDRKLPRLEEPRDSPANPRKCASNVR